MRKFLSFLLLFFTFLHSCKDEVQTDELEINLTELAFQAEAGNMDFVITSNTSWTVDLTASWVTCNPTSGDNGSTLSVKVEENSAITTRQGKIIITSDDGKIVKEVKVIQIGATPTIIVLPVEGEAAADPEGDEVKVTVVTTANLPWTVVIPEESFVSEKTKTGKDIVFEISPNTTGEYREELILFKLDGTEKSAIFKITQEVIPSIVVPETVDADPEGGDVKVQVTATAGYEWTVEIPDGAFVTAKSNSDNEMVFEATSNNTGNSRQVNVVFKLTGTDKEAKLTITQNPAPRIVVPATVSASPSGGDVKVQVTATEGFDWTVQIPAGAFVSEKSKTDTEIVFTADANTTGESREVTVIFKLTGTNKEATLMITQDPKSTIVDEGIVSIRPAGTLNNPEYPQYWTVQTDGYSGDANEREWKDYIPEENRFIMQDHTERVTTRRLHVILIKNETDQPTGPVEFKLEGFDPNAITVRWDQNALFEGNSGTQTMINTTLKNTGIAAGQEAFVAFRIRNTTVPQNTADFYESKFTITGAGINIEGTIEINVVPAP